MARFRAQQHIHLCQIQSVQASLATAQLRRAGHVIRMVDERYVKTVLFSELKQEIVGRPTVRIQRRPEAVPRAAEINSSTWEREAVN